MVRIGDPACVPANWGYDLATAGPGPQKGRGPFILLESFPWVPSTKTLPARTGQQNSAGDRTPVKSVLLAIVKMLQRLCKENEKAGSVSIGADPGLNPVAPGRYRSLRGPVLQRWGAGLSSWGQHV